MLLGAGGATRWVYILVGVVDVVRKRLVVYDLEKRLLFQVTLIACVIS